MSQPVQYRDGLTEFCGHRFLTDSRALIPRFETEYLVNRAVDWCLENEPDRGRSIVDIGTGSGAIAVSVALALPKARITAIDISDEALSLARENAIRHHVEDRIDFRKGDLLENFSDPADIILANLPYIPAERIAKLDSSVRDYEPHRALNGGEDGFELYRRLFEQTGKFKPSLCVFEFDEGQEGFAKEAAAKWLPDMALEILKDSSGLTRYVVLKQNQ